jgi:energy-coupling factor transporter ATP-binding protein EcfA2
MNLYLENVRSFEGWHDIGIAPATVLLGENSAGKSTLLGMLSVVHQDGFPFSGNIFNQFPFEFGGYKTVASSKKGVTHFSVGFQTVGEDFPGILSPSSNTEPRRDNFGVIVSFRDNDGLPVPCYILIWWGNTVIAICEEAFKHLNPAKQIASITNHKVNIFFVHDASPQGLTFQIIQSAMLEMRSGGRKKTGAIGDEELMMVFRIFRGGLIRRGQMSSIAFAPMRSRPKRTYDQLSDQFSPEGDHVPLLLARATDPNNRQAKALHAALAAFGGYSEMFSDIVVKQLGKGSGDPFQVQVKMGAKKSNLMDVGYGVSQILPLIVDAQRAGPNTTLLLQQPEVHLHPKAQAALGSMIKDWVSKSKQTVVVETHSDYLVDRLRLEVKREQLKTGDIKILYLEKHGSQTLLHALKLDTQGNVLDAPVGYRDFFLREQVALLVD